MNYKDILVLGLDPQNPTDDEITRAIRNYRNEQLQSSDYTQLGDVPLTNKAAWIAYRQELRDMMGQSEDPKLIVFPEPPSENA